MQGEPEHWFFKSHEPTWKIIFIVKAIDVMSVLHKIHFQGFVNLNSSFTAETSPILAASSLSTNDQMPAQFYDKVMVMVVKCYQNDGAKEKDAHQ